MSERIEVLQYFSSSFFYLNIDAERRKGLESDTDIAECTAYRKQERFFVRIALVPSPQPTTTKSSPSPRPAPPSPLRSPANARLPPLSYFKVQQCPHTELTDHGRKPRFCRSAEVLIFEKGKFTAPFACGGPPARPRIPRRACHDRWSFRGRRRAQFAYSPARVRI
ncbi:hypothetical protein GWI33_015741 [Rhynchophorus ferrugineus]|uniref:Uncharacterized protein n=1 Tax=Rhynchophorus ferrugineus TaxID=354439 RepID=A0A834I2V9_RHYFE|nr:hypothetical protein GWI33_015741 [Rhynchophorus ferrugineus]